MQKTENGKFEFLDKYTGEWENDQMHGKGKLELVDDELYEGEFYQGEANGRFCLILKGKGIMCSRMETSTLVNFWMGR